MRIKDNQIIRKAPGAPVTHQVPMKPINRSLLLMSLVSSLFALSACGGGGGESTPDDKATTQKVVTTDASETATASALAGGSTATPVSWVIRGTGWVSAPLLLPDQRSRATTPTADSSGYMPVFTGTGYYVDRDNGNDSNPGTLAAPWRTLAKASSAPLQAGDALLLKCGSVWRESLEVTSALSRTGDFLIGAYGDCSNNTRPVIRASDWVPTTGWSRVADDDRPIYTRAASTAVTRLFIDGAPQIPARYPNFKGVGAEYALAVNLASRQSFKLKPADLAALASRDLIGATVHVKTTQWMVETAKIQAFDASTGVITLDRQLPFTVRDGAGFILEGKRWMLDTPGEWFYDADTKELMAWTTDSASPAAHSGIEAAWRESGLTVKWLKNVRIERLRFEQQSGNGLTLIETPDASVRDVISMHSRDIGISVLSSPRVSVIGSKVVGAGEYGIVMRESNDARVQSNHVSDTGGFARADTTDAAITVLGSGSVVSSNLVERSANIGIRFGNREGTVVEGNSVFYSCLRFTDCSGIYTFTASAPKAPETTYVARGMVRNNIIVGAKSNLEGCGFSCANLAVGIYLDELTSGVTLQGNTISDTEVGLGMHNASFNILNGNKVRNVSFSSIRVIQTRSDQTYVVGNKFTNNSLVAGKTTALVNGLPAETGSIHAFYWFHSASPVSLVTTQNNTVSNNTILSTQKGGEATWSLATWSSNKILKKSEWTGYAPTDVAVSRVTFKDYSVTTEANLLKNGAFNPATTDGWTTYFNPAGTGGVFAMGTFTGCGSNCARYVAGHSSDYLTSNTFQLNSTAGQNLYVLRMKAIGGANGGMKRAVVRRPVSPWENYGLSIPATPLANGEVADVEQFFLATSSDAGVLDLRSAVGGETLFRDVSLQRVSSIAFQQPKQLVSHVINPTPEDLTYPCVALQLNSCDLVDENGAKVVFPMRVPARSTALVFAKDPNWVAN
jgi:parallel beta-helix repeat protein